MFNNKATVSARTSLICLPHRPCTVTPFEQMKMTMIMMILCVAYFRNYQSNQTLSMSSQVWRTVL